MTTQYEAGYKLRDLKAFIETCVGNQIAKRLQCEMSDISLSLNSRHMGQGMDLLLMRYQGEFYFDRFPFRDYSPAVLFCNVGAWLMDNDTERDDGEPLADPEVDVVLEDEHSAEVIITVDFEEPVRVIDDENGPIYWRGKTWRIEEYEIWVAKSLRDVVVKYRD